MIEAAVAGLAGEFLMIGVVVVVVVVVVVAKGVNGENGVAVVDFDSAGLNRFAPLSN